MQFFSRKEKLISGLETTRTPPTKKKKKKKRGAHSETEARSKSFYKINRNN